MAKITVEVPEALVGDIYIAIGNVLQDDQYALEDAAERRTDTGRDEDDEPATED
jgi:hypothetical protein